MYRKQDVATHPLSGPPNTLCTSMERPVNVSDEVAKETQDFVGGCSHHNLQLTQQVKLPLVLKDGNGATRC